MVAAGAIERPLVVPDNDRPGVMSADAALVYLKRYAVLIGKRVVVATNNDSAYPVAEALAEAGAEVELVDMRADGPASPLRATHGAAESRASSGAGASKRCASADRRATATPCFCRAAGRRRCIFTPRRADGCATTSALAALVPTGGVEGLTVAGAANGAFTLAEALRQGHEAAGGEGASPNAPAGNYRIEASWPKADDEGRRWIDFQNDVTLKDVALAAREGYVSVEHLKRYTTLGMATDQGKTANVNGHCRDGGADWPHDR